MSSLRSRSGPPSGPSDSGTHHPKAEPVRMREARTPRSSPRECPSFCSKKAVGTWALACRKEGRKLCPRCCSPQLPSCISLAAQPLA